MKNFFTANAILSDNTIISIMVVDDNDKYTLSITILPKGYYKADKKYSKIINKDKDLYSIIEDEVRSISKSSDYKITFNF